MNYKISTYVLSAALIGILIYSCSSKNEGSADATLAVQEANTINADCPCETALPEEQLKAMAANKITRLSGDTIRSDSARELLRQFKEDFKIDCNDPDTKHIHGFSFGIEKFLLFADEVRKLDGKTKNILGVRVYYARKKKKTGPNMPDLFMVPIDNNGRSIYDIDECSIPKNASDVRNGTVILNTSVPCPNQCQ